MTKEYVIPVNPISWKRPGLRDKKFYDGQCHNKLSCGLHLRHQHGDAPQFVKPIHLEVVFYLPQPKLIKNRNKVWSSSYPDIDNLQKFLFDAINDTGVIWIDDRIVSSLTAKKIYDKNPRTCVIIRELE